jgi:adenosylcobinamide-GDP ribazoletransferase
MRRLSEEWTIFLLALQFLTRLPLPPDVGWSAERMAATPRWHPAVGAVVAAVSSLAYAAAAMVGPPVFAAVAATAAGIVATGAFHEDGLADTCDGLGGGGERDRVLEIMRDSRIGTFGALGLGLVVAAKVAALAALPAAAVPAVLMAGHIASRTSSVAVIATSRYVRDHGTGKPVADGIGAGGFAVALGTGAAALLAIGLALPPECVAGAILGLGLGHWLIRRTFERRLGGYTGDCLGAVQQTSELGIYIGVLACV